jgi:hypothetical protein
MRPGAAGAGSITLKVIQNQFGNAPSSVATLNATTIGELSYVVVFGDEHKDWPPQIFCKSNLDLLPKDWATINNAQQVDDRWEVAKLYPIFTQLDGRTHPCRAASRSGGLFEFSGYHALAHIEST